MFPRSKLQVKGQWLLVTGASSGLGAALARELAKTYGANLILAARRKELLDRVAHDIEASTSVKVVTLQADLATPDGIERVAQAVHARAAVGAVLNAAAPGHGYFSTSAQSLHDVLQTNVVGLTDLLARLIQMFTQRSGRGGILVVSSLGGETSLPHQAVYAGSKAYATTLVQSLAHELRGTPVSIGVVLPGGIDTEMARLANLDTASLAARFGLQSAEECARLAARALVSGKRITVPGLLNKIVYAASRILPRPAMSALAAAPYRLPPRRPPLSSTSDQ